MDSTDTNLRIIRIKNPFDRTTREVSDHPFNGQTLQRLVDVFLPLDIEFRASINGQIIEKENWPLTKAKAGDYIVFVPVVSGGGDGDKAILSIVLMIAVIIAAPWIAGNVLGLTAGTLAYALASATIVVAGGVLISSLMPRPQAKKPAFAMSSESSQTYGWDPATMQRQGLPIPRFYGRNKLYGNVIAAWSETTGWDTNIQKLFMIASICMGPIYGVYDKGLVEGAIPQGTICFWGFCASPNYIDDVVVTDPDSVELMNDDFDDGNTTGWTLVNDCGVGAPTFTNPDTTGKLSADVPTPGTPDEIDEIGAFAKWDAGSAWTDYTLTCKIYPDDWSAFGIMFRYIDQDNYYRLGFDIYRNRTRLCKRRNGETTILWEGANVLTRYQWHDLEIGVVGGKITASVDSTELFEPIQAYIDSDSEVRINDQPIINFANAAFQTRNGILTPTVMHGFDKTKLEVVPNRKVSSLTPAVYETPDSDFDNLEVDLTFPAGLYDASGGGLANYSVVVKVEIKKITESDDDYITITKDTETLTDDTTSKVIRTIKTCRRKITGITKANPGVVTTQENHDFSDGDSITFTEIAGMTELEGEVRTISNTTLKTFEIADTSGYGVAGTAGIAHKQLSDIVVRGSKYNVKVTKITDDKNDVLYGDSLYLERIRQVYEVSLTYPRTALVGIDVVATDQLSGTIGFSCIADCLYVRIYDDVAETWSIGYSTNPAWVLFDLLTQPVYSGSGTEADPFVVERYDGIDPSRLDLVKFVELADFCDQEIDNDDTINISHVSREANAVIRTMAEHALIVGDEIIVTDVDGSYMTDFPDDTRGTVTEIIDSRKFTVDIDTSAYLPYDPVLLLHFDGDDAATDTENDSHEEHQITFHANAQLDVDQKKFGESSLLVDGVGDYLSTPNSSDFDFGTGDFTIEFQVRRDGNAPDYAGIISSCYSIGAPSPGWGIRFGSVAGGNQNKMCFISDGSGAHAQDISASQIVPDQTWTHIAVVRHGNTLTMYQDGVSVGSVDVTGWTLDSGGQGVVIGRTYTDADNYYFNKHIDEIRVVKGKALWTENFTPPTVAHVVEPSGTIAKVKHFIEFNGGFDSATTMWEAALKICEIARAVMLWNGTKITLAIDKAASPVQMFAVGNIIEDSFKETFLPEKDRASEIEVHYRDRKQDYKRVPFTIFNTEINNPSNKVTLDLFGITDSVMAENAGNFRLLQNQLLKRTLEFEVDIDALACIVGDVIYVQHDVPNWGRIGSGDQAYNAGGRIASADQEGANHKVTIDCNLEAALDPGKTYEIMVRLSDDTIETKTITSIVENVVTISGTFTGTLLKDDVWAIGEQNLVAELYRIINLERAGDQQCKIMTIEYNSAVYADDPS